MRSERNRAMVADATKAMLIESADNKTKNKNQMIETSEDDFDDRQNEKDFYNGTRSRAGS